MGMTLLSPRPELCQCCATDHPEEAPHNQNSVHWHYWFYGQKGRWPTWHDAMAHCDDTTKERWTRVLSKYGVIVMPPTEPDVPGDGTIGSVTVVTMEEPDDIDEEEDD